MLNVNIGLLGHVDAGKTSLAKALSRTASTAAFDKSPQSQSRGITLDLGFSSREVAASDADCGGDLIAAAGLERALCTFVDCPGHASLIRTVVGGAQIIDVMVLVIDATKGIQVQTAECLVLGEVLAKPLVVAINKVDAIQGATQAEKAEALTKLRRRLAATFAKTRWPTVHMIEVSAAPRCAIDKDGKEEEVDNGVLPPVNTARLLASALALVDLKALHQQWSAKTDRPEDFLLLVDHCFALKGQGTVFTGTVLGGVVRVGDSVLLPEQQAIKKVKGLQVFRKPVSEARRGDRVGMCVTQFDSSLMERGVVCYAGNSNNNANSSSDADATGAIATVKACGGSIGQASSVLIVEVHRVRFHPLACDSQTKFHISLGHATVMGTMRFFSRPWKAQDTLFDLWQESQYVEELGEEAFLSFDTDANPPLSPGHPAPVKRSVDGLVYYAVLLLERPIFASVGSTLLAMRLDVERENFCRIALAGEVRAILSSPSSSSTGGSGRSFQDGPLWRSLPIVRIKVRTLDVDRVVDARTCIADGLVSSLVDSTAKQKNNTAESVKKQTAVMHAEVQKFVGLRVRYVPATEAAIEMDASQEGLREEAVLPETVEGRIDSTFGKTGKVKLIFAKDVFVLPTAGGKGGKKDGARDAGVFMHAGRIEFSLKKYPLSLYASMQQ